MRRACKTLKAVFAGLKEDVTEENIQSRARGSLLMAMSNKLARSCFPPATRARLAVGYCTLYGDMVGGLAVISDVPKTLVYRLSRYVNSLRPVIPEATIEKPPSAELRPDQKDSDSLPPYDVLDAILEDYVEELRFGGADCEGARLRSGAGAARDPHGGTERVQAAASRAGYQDFRQRPLGTDAAFRLRQSRRPDGIPRARCAHLNPFERNACTVNRYLSP